MSWLRQKAQSDDNQYVRSTAISELASGWHDRPETFDSLANCAAKDPFVRGEEEFAVYDTNPRRTALQGIVKYFSNHPQTKDLLSDRANNDPDKQVREFAQETLENLSE